MFTDESYQQWERVRQAIARHLEESRSTTEYHFWLDAYIMWNGEVLYAV